MHIQYQSFITKHYNTIQSSVAFITVVHYSEIVFKQAATERKEKQEKLIINQKKKKEKRNQVRKKEKAGEEIACDST